MARKQTLTALALICCSAAASADRLLLEDGETHVTLQGVHQCGDPVDLAVDADDPDLFTAHSRQMQGIIDAAGAALAFECDRLAEIRVEGRLKGLRDPVYRAAASPANDWRIIASQSINDQAEAGENLAPRPEPGYPAATPADDGGNGFELVDLRPGLTVNTTREIIADRFGETPDYDIVSGTMTLDAGGCPTGYDWRMPAPAPEAGWKCLSTRFTDQRDTRLYHIELIQVIRGSDTHPLIQRLVDNFGPPAEQWTAPANQYSGGFAIEQLSWGEAVSHGQGSGRAMRQLEAAVYRRDGVLVTVVTLQDPSLRPGWSAPPPIGGGDLQL